MVETFLLSLAEMYSYLFNCVSTLFSAAGGFDVWLSLIIFLMAYRSIFKPIFGSMGSDKVTKRKKEDSE